MGNVYSFKLDRDEINESLGGGFPKGSLVLIIGPNGSGKSVFCQRFAFGLLDNEHTVTYICTQSTSKGFIRQLDSLDYLDKIKWIRQEILYIPVYPLINTAKPRDDFVGKLMGAQALFEKDVIIIDNLSAFVRYNTEPARSLQLIGFFKKITGMEKTVILTMDDSEIEPKIITEFRDAANILITLRQRQMGTEMLRTAIIEKFSAPSVQIGAMFGYKVEKGMGVMIDIGGVA